MKSLDRRWSVARTLGLVLLFLVAVPTEAREQMVTITKEQWASLNNKLELWAYGFLAFLAKEAWDIFKNRGKNLVDIEKGIERINETMKGLATKEYVQEETRKAVSHYHDIQR